MELFYFIKSLSLFAGLSENDIRQLLNVAEIKTYRKKDVVFVHGDPANCFFIIAEGCVKLCRSTREGSEVVLAMFTRGDSFGEAVLIDGAVYPHNAEALEESKIIEFPASILKNPVFRNSGLSLRLMQSMSRQIERLQLENEHLAVMTATERTACLIHQIYQTQKHVGSFNGEVFKFPYDKHLAAIRLGMKPETFSRTLKDLQAIGVNIANDEIIIKDAKALEELCCANCSATPYNCPLTQNSLCQKRSR